MACLLYSTPAYYYQCDVRPLVMYATIYLRFCNQEISWYICTSPLFLTVTCLAHDIVELCPIYYMSFIQFLNVILDHKNTFNVSKSFLLLILPSTIFAIPGWYSLRFQKYISVLLSKLFNTDTGDYQTNYKTL